MGSNVNRKYVNKAQRRLPALIQTDRSSGKNYCILLVKEIINFANGERWSR